MDPVEHVLAEIDARIAELTAPRPRGLRRILARMSRWRRTRDPV